MHGIAVKTAHTDAPNMECPAFRSAVEVVTGKWKIAIVSTLMDGPQRFGEIRGKIPGITQHMLTLQLRELEHYGLLVRTAYAEIPPRVVYELTDAAYALRPVCDSLLAWSKKYGERVASV